MADSQEKIVFTTEDGEDIDFFVLGQTTINGVNYLLVADSDKEEEEANALILEETQAEDAEEMIYNVVEEDAKLKALSKVFSELLDDIDFDIE
jgi:hypothetical protein